DRGRRLRPQLRDRPEPGRDRRRQGPAWCGGRGDGRLRAPARGRHLAGKARGGGLHPRPRRADRARPDLGRAAAAAAAARRGPPLRARLPPPAPQPLEHRLDLRQPARRRPGPAASADAAVRDGRRPREREPGRARIRPRPAGEGRPRRVRGSASHRLGNPGAAFAVKGSVRSAGALLALTAIATGWGVAAPAPAEASCAEVVVWHDAAYFDYVASALPPSAGRPLPGAVAPGCNDTGGDPPPPTRVAARAIEGVSPAAALLH